MYKQLLLVLMVMLVATSVFARDTINAYSVAETMELEQTRQALGDEVSFYFGDQAYKKESQSFGEARTNKKTNAFNKSDKEACQWVFLSAMIALRDRAIELGGNAVINIKSNYRDNLTSSETTYQCGAGALIAGVALVGTIVKIDK